MSSQNPYYTSQTLVDAVRRRCSLPKADSMFSDQDILDFANDELMESILPMIKSSHEEYFVWSENEALVESQAEYSIPERAIGNGLRDLSYLDLNGNEYEMSRISRDTRYDRFSVRVGDIPLIYYVENSHITLVSGSNVRANGYLKKTYLLRPNNLVLPTRVSKISASTENSVLISTITNGVTTQFVTTSNHFLEDNEEITIESVSGIDASLVNDTFTVTVVDDTTFTIDVDTSAAGALTGGLVYNNTTKITVDNISEEITTNTTVDFLKSKSPHNTLAIDISPLEINYTSLYLVFKTTDLPSYATGDTIALSYETDIPGIPTELHRLLISKVCERVLESIGDQAGTALAAAKAQRSEISTGTLIENRVTSAPLKVVNSHSLLRGKIRRSRGV